MFRDSKRSAIEASKEPNSLVEEAATDANVMDRRSFVQTSGAVGAAGLGISSTTAAEASHRPQRRKIADQFSRADSMFHGEQWESLNPGFWKIKNGALRRRLFNVGDRARSTGFPFHYANVAKKMPTDYDPSLPAGIIYRRDSKLDSDFNAEAHFTYLGDGPGASPNDNPEWKMFQPGYGRMGLAFGAKSIFESYNRIRNAIQVVWCNDNKLRFVVSGKAGAKATPKAVEAPPMQRGQTATLRVSTTTEGPMAQVLARLEVRTPGSNQPEIATIEGHFPVKWIRGFVGITGQGRIDFQADQFSLECQTAATSAEVGIVDCYSCYALGDTLKEVDGKYRVRFVSIFESDGDHAEIRISKDENPKGGWESVPVAGSNSIINNTWRRNTSVIEAELPSSPAESDLYYTIWKDGVNVTADQRLGTAAVGPGTGLVGDVPASGRYVGRLPQLKAPYKLCGLSCHAINSGLQQPTETGFRMSGGSDDWQIRDQPTLGAYQHLEDYNFQVMVWEDDVWYMELVLYPPSTDDAFKVIKNSICGPTSRWQMMRHWNVINPGDHDYGMDDIKGPEQLVIRNVDGLGQDASYIRRNFQIVHHLVTGEENVDGRVNPKKWRAWKMPNRDFTFIIVDSRLWRSSQDTDMWDDAGWDAFKNLYDRTDPTRSLLGEEQFSWLERQLQTDSSPLVCITGLNGLHTIWAGVNYKGGSAGQLKGPFDQRDRVAADYAGWVKAGADRVIELLGSRDGVVTVYGDVHNGCIMKNTDHGVIECSFGPIGRSGGRAVIPGFGPKMKDFDGRPVDIYSLYHKTHATPDLQPHSKGQPYYWNFLEMAFDPSVEVDQIDLNVRNLIDPPSETPRGGGSLKTLIRDTGRAYTCRLPETTTIPNADVRIATVDGLPVRGTRSDSVGLVQIHGLADLDPGTKLVLTAFDGDRVESKVVVTESI
ncbi:MAG: hypothetical protein ACE361_22220 [Aureliella sp.]